MSWASSPTIPTRTPSRGWFGTPPTPAAREHQLYWRQLVEAVWSATLPALSAALLGEHRQSGSLEVALRRAVAAFAAEHQQVGALDGGLHRLGMLATDITMGELHATGRPAAAALTGQQTMAGVMGAATRPITAAVTGQQVYAAAMAGEVKKLTTVLTGEQSQAGVLAATQPKLTAALTGSQTQTGALAAAMKKVLFAGTAAHTQSGSLAAAAKKLLAVLAGTGIHPHEDWSATTPGTWTYIVPAWCKTGDKLDLILYAAGRGGDKGTSTSSRPGGRAGAIASATLTVGVDVAPGGTLSGQLGAGGAKNGGNGGNTTCTQAGLTALGATSNNGSNGSNGDSPGNRTQGTLTVTGGTGGSGSSSSSGGNGGNPGGGGGGGGSLFFFGQDGGAGARGQVNIRARDQFA